MPFLIAIIALLLFSSPSQAETIDSIAAIVNDDIITCYDVNRDTAEMLQKIRQSGVTQQPSIKRLNQRSLDDRIIKTLELQKAKQLDLHVDEDELNNALASIESRNQLLPGQLKEVITQQGGDFDEFKENLHDQILISKLIDMEVRGKLQVSEEAIAEYYRKYVATNKPRREVELAEIFLAVPTEPTPEQLAIVRKKINQIHQRLLHGEAFAQLVAAYSESPDREKQGVMGWFAQGGIVPRFASALELKVGEITEPIRSPSGFHILKAINERWKEPEALGESYDEAHARHILLRIPSSADEATRAKIRRRAEGIASDMKNADDEAFAARAKEVSQGPSAENGGDLGWFKKGTMLPAFEKVVFAMQPGETSGVVETQFGLHIIRLVGKRHVDPNSLQANHDKIQQILSNIEMQEQLPRWIAGLKADADIQLKSCDSANMTLAGNGFSLQGASSGEADDAAIKKRIEAWRQAWESHDAAAYFAAYSSHYHAGKRYPNIEAWRTERRQRVNNRGIRITLGNMKILHTDARHVRVLFDQHYRAGKIDTHDHKMLIMAREGNDWKIVREMTQLTHH